MTVHEVARALPDIAVLRDRCRALAVLDAILSPQWESRYYSFDSRWAHGEEMASMRNGSGDEYSIVFLAAGAFIRGFDHESPMSPAFSEFGEVWPGVADSVPEVFADCMSEPAFSFEGGLAATVCLWRQRTDDRWHTGEIEFPAGPDPDGAHRLFAVLTDATPLAYRRFAEDYYEQRLDGAATADIHALRPLTNDVVRRLNPELSIADLAEDLAQIGYPVRPDERQP
ncbi:hypothetical protein GCM10027280_40590 [Micromonospora polyrhachis]|uniref:Uncharacterized protein n=1 Tax=Micromonospora polyrhachis TaxID=1282883 RepID=A0A7W7SL11_9ACTN|nr:hypothetical protein [Micromonospora polyrhachis]